MTLPAGMRSPAGLGRLGLALVALFALLAWLAPVVPARAEVTPGPPFPDPVVGQAVYDTAGLFNAPTIADAEATIDRIEVRTGAEVVATPRSSRAPRPSRPRPTRSR